MLHVPLDQITEEHLRALERDGVPEGLELDFKEALDLSTDKAKKEVAKDVSAMANALGGRLVYGADEEQGSSGTVAGALRPLNDPTLEERLANILNTTITPRPRLQTRAVPVAGGFVLIVEVFASETDLHMVSGYGDNRYYRRGAKGNVPMSEPEVREMYERIATTKSSLEDRLEAAIGPEKAGTAAMAESIIIVPWHPGPDLIGSRTTPEVHAALSVELASLYGPQQAQDLVRRLKVEGVGYRHIVPSETGQGPFGWYLSLSRTGIVQLASNLTFTVVENGKPLALTTPKIVEHLLLALLCSRCVLGSASYYGKVRLHYRLTASDTFILDPDWVLGIPRKLGAVQTITAPPIDFAFREIGGGFGPVISRVLDSVFQATGVPQNPFFDDAGRLLRAHKDRFGVDRLL